MVLSKNSYNLLSLVESNSYVPKSTYVRSLLIPTDSDSSLSTSQEILVDQHADLLTPEAVPNKSILGQNSISISGTQETPTNVHHLTTRSKNGVFKPKVFPVSKELSSMEEALAQEQWK